MSIPVVLIHSDDAMRASLARGLDGCDDIVLVASVRSAHAGVRGFEQQSDAVVLIEQQIADGTGRVALLEQLRLINPRVQTIMVIDNVEAPAIIAAVRSGIAAIVPIAFA